MNVYRISHLETYDVRRTTPINDYQTKEQVVAAILSFASFDLGIFRVLTKISDSTRIPPSML